MGSVPPAVRGQFVAGGEVRERGGDEEDDRDRDEEQDERHALARLRADRRLDRVDRREDDEPDRGERARDDEHVAGHLSALHVRLRRAPRLDREEAEQEPEDRTREEEQGLVQENRKSTPLN